jgi:hypothetical protein
MAPDPADILEIQSWINQQVEAMREFLCSRCHEICPDDVNPTFIDTLRASTNQDIGLWEEIVNSLRANIVSPITWLFISFKLRLSNS